MNAYFAIFKIRAATLFQYRSAAFAGICVQFFFGLVSIMIFKAFYAGATLKEPLSLAQTMTFVWLSQSLIALLPWHPDRDIESQIKSGQVAYELARPLHLYGIYFAKSLAIRLIPLILRCLPIYVIAGFFLELQRPVSLISFPGFIASLVLAIFLSAAITAFVSITLFWTLSGDGIKRFLPNCVSILSGTMIPLPLFPSWMQPFLNWQPFRGIVDIPCRLYTGVIPTDQIFYFLGFQLVWTLLLIYGGKSLLHRATQRLSIQGG